MPVDYSGISMAKWRDQFGQHAEQEGWGLEEFPIGFIAVGSVNDLSDAEAITRADEAALSLVFEQAMRGDLKSIYALYLDGKDVNYPDVSFED